MTAMTPMGSRVGAAADATATRPSPLLRLPPHVRRLIYLHVGVASPHRPRPYTFDLHGRKACDLAAPPGSLYGLLMCCRAIYVEVTAILYSANHFIIHYSIPGSLAPLLGLTAPSLRSLTSLKVILNQASCHNYNSYDDLGGCCVDGEAYSDSTCSRYHRGEKAHQTPLLGPDPSCHDDPEEAARVMLQEWHSAALHLSSSIDSGRLNLFLVCDIDPRHQKALETAKLATAPIRLLPLLKDCHVRLCKVPNSRLQKVAQQAVLGARGVAMPYSTPPPTPRLMQLPRELRLYILEHTDLVTPWMEVSWDRFEGGYTIEYTNCTELDGFGTKTWPSIHHGCQFAHCWLKSWRRGVPLVGCFCRRRHTAFSSSCQCWNPPGPSIFLVCRNLCADARLVFFSRNRFIIPDYSALTPLTPPKPPLPYLASSMRQGPYPYAELAASIFLRGGGDIVSTVPASCLGHLRFLELVFPAYHWNTWPQADHPAMRDWRETAAWLRDRMNLSALTMRLITTRVVEEVPEPHQTLMTDAQGKVMLGSYEAIMEPLKQWAEMAPAGRGADGSGGRLARFYVELACPWYWTTDTDEWWEQDLSEYHDEKRRDRERKEAAERAVMGARYENMYADGRMEPGQSVWRGVWYHFYEFDNWPGPC